MLCYYIISSWIALVMILYRPLYSCNNTYLTFSYWKIFGWFLNTNNATDDISVPKSISEFWILSLEKIFRNIPEDIQITASKNMNIWWVLDTSANCCVQIIFLKDPSRISLWLRSVYTQSFSGFQLPWAKYKILSPEFPDHLTITWDSRVYCSQVRTMSILILETNKIAIVSIAAASVNPAYLEQRKRKKKTVTCWSCRL